MGRIWNLIRGFIYKYIYSVEKENPEIVYNNAIEQVVRSYSLLKGKAGAVVRRAQELALEVASTKQSYEKVNELLQAAASLPAEQVDETAAAEMINTRDQLQEKLNGLVSDLSLAQQDQKELTEALLEVESEKRKLLAEKDSQIGRFRSAQARLAIMERQDGTSIDSINQSLTGVRENIKNTIAEASLTKELQSNTLENKVKAFTKKTEEQSALQKFRAMREASAQKSAGSQVLDQIVEKKAEKTA
jgi:phage shock protein A